MYPGNSVCNLYQKDRIMRPCWRLTVGHLHGFIWKLLLCTFSEPAINPSCTVYNPVGLVLWKSLLCFRRHSLPLEFSVCSDKWQNDELLWWRGTVPRRVRRCTSVVIGRETLRNVSNTFCGGLLWQSHCIVKISGPPMADQSSEGAFEMVSRTFHWSTQKSRAKDGSSALPHKLTPPALWATLCPTFGSLCISHIRHLRTHKAGVQAIHLQSQRIAIEELDQSEICSCSKPKSSLYKTYFSILNSLWYKGGTVNNALTQLALPGKHNGKASLAVKHWRSRDTSSDSTSTVRNLNCWASKL